MNNYVRRNLTLSSILATALSALLFPCLLAIVFWFVNVRSVSAEDTLKFKIPHEVLRSSMLVIDLDGDHKKEMLFGSIDGYLTVVNGASYHVVWDKYIGDYLKESDNVSIDTGLAAADLNNDGKLEIVIATGSPEVARANSPGAIVVLTYVGGGTYFEQMPGWPVYAFDELGASSNRPDGRPDGFTSTPSLGDIDGDGDLEIVIGGMDRRLHAFHHDGTYVLGWPLDNKYRIYRESRSTAALADLDGDGILDIYIGSNNYKIPACANPYLFYGVKADSTPLLGFPIETTQNIESSPAIGDINGDGSPDIIFGTGDYNESCGQPGGQKSDGKKVYAVDRFGQPLPGWPVRTNANMPNSPALGDLDNDGMPEVVMHTLDTLYAWHGDGSLVQGFPVNGEYHYRFNSPVLADVDGDSEVEIILSSGQVYGPTGELEQSREKLQSQVVVIDQDGDGLLETIGTNHYNYNFGWHLQVYVYQETGQASGATPWPMFHRTQDRNGLLPPLYTVGGQIVNESNQAVAGVEVALSNGRIAVTDGQGKYIFSNLPSGNYTVIPTYQNNRFAPKELSIGLATNTTLETFVMKPPLYDIQGKILQANRSPLAGVTVRLNNGKTLTTDKNGVFSFNDQQPGRYTIRPMSPDLTYLPEQRAVTAEDEIAQIFYALPKPIQGTLNPNTSTEIMIEDTQGLATTVTFPEGLAEGDVIITPRLAEEPNGYLAAGHTLEIALVASEASAQTSLVNPSLVNPSLVNQGGEPLAIQIQIEYNQADLQTLLAADELVLFWQSPDGWVDAQESCSAGFAADNNLADKVVTVSVCQWGTYGLFAPFDQMFIPELFGRD